MEERIGQWWHRAISRAARRDHPHATASLEEMRRPASVLFRALGGEAGLRVEASTETTHGGHRSLLQRLAGSGGRIELAWRDEQTLRLPARIAWFPERELNRRLYLWLAALAAVSPRHRSGDWLQRHAAASAELLRRYPGLQPLYQALVTAHLRQRPAANGLSADEAAREHAIRRALLDPARVGAPLPAASRAPHPVPLWLHPAPPAPAGAVAALDDDGAPGQGDHSEACDTDKRRRGERVAMPDGKDGLLAFRLESLFSRAEYAAVDRTTEDKEDNDAKAAAEDLDVLSMARDRRRSATRLRFDLDLPPEDNDDLRLGDGILQPEWDFRQQVMQAEHCRVQPMQARHAVPAPLPAPLRAQARRLHAQFEMLRPRRIWLRNQTEGGEMDIQAVIDHAADRRRGAQRRDAALFRSFRNAERDLSCLLLADLSLSTDSWVNNGQRVIDVIRDSLLLFSQALAASGDRFALYGFSSRRRDHVRVHILKTFGDAWSERVQGRIQAIRPGYYTRMGAAIRYATQLLEHECSSRKLLLILTDGKPNDLDKYEGRYGIEDTRMAVRQAATRDIHPFCVTIDARAHDYLPYLFGSRAYTRVRRAEELPARLPQLYARLTG